MAQAESNEMLSPGEDIKPVLTTDRAIELIRSLYGLEVKKIKELNSYDDKNFLVYCEEKTSNPNISIVNKDGYVLKILNSMDSQKTHVEAEHEMQLCLKQHGILCSTPIINLEGKDKKLVRMNETGPQHITRLLTFIPGKILHEVPYTPKICYQVGQQCGNLQKTLLENLRPHPSLVSHQTIWGLENVSQLKDFIGAILDHEDQKRVEKVVENFEKHVKSVEDRLKKGVIHGDLNEQNIIVRKCENNNEDEFEIAALIDFGDSNYSCLIYDLAICIMYLMVESTVIDPLSVGGHVVAGYSKVMTSLSELEWEVLPYCVMARFAQSLTMGAYTLSQHPENEYVVVCAKNGWPLLRKMVAMEVQTIRKTWKNIADTYNN